MSRTERRKRRALRRARRRARARRSRPSRGRALRALGSSALALPGLAGSAVADTPTDRYSADYRFSFYTEDPLDDDQVSPGGETDRYEIEIHQLRFEMPLGDRLDVGLDLAHETMSGATPWYVDVAPDGDPVQVMTGATVDDARTDATLSGRAYFDRASLGVKVGASFEKDYLAWNGGVEGEYHLAEKNTTLLGGLGFSVDRLEPTDGGEVAFRPESEEKHGVSGFGGVSQILTRSAAVQSTLTYQYAGGFLSDPYKRVVVAGAPRGDARPDVRHQLAWLTRYRQHVELLNGTLHADYQFYIDDWKINSHTLELAWYQSLWRTLELVGALRYYSQSQADFYAPFFLAERSDDLHSSDYRLSPYGAISWRLEASTRFRTGPLDWDARVGWERYLSDADFALGSVDVENPGLVSFHVFSVGLQVRF